MRTFALGFIVVVAIATASACNFNADRSLKNENQLPESLQ